MYTGFSKYLAQHNNSGRIMLVGPFAESTLDIVEPVIFVDGGSIRRENDIGLAVGDGDSFDGRLDHLLDTDKDFSDLAFALSLLGHNFDRVEMHGFLGGRRDHELLNLGEVYHFLSRRVHPTAVVLDHAIEALSKGDWHLEVHGIFSLVAFEVTTVSLSGECKYRITGGTQIDPVSSFGLSNEGYGTIRIETSSPLFLFRNSSE